MGLLQAQHRGQRCPRGCRSTHELSRTQIEESVRSMVMRYGSRLWKLRVLQAEVKINIRLTPTTTAIPIRLFLTNESGYYLDISLYKEVRDSSTGNVSSHGRWQQTEPHHDHPKPHPSPSAGSCAQERAAASCGKAAGLFLQPPALCSDLLCVPPLCVPPPTLCPSLQIMFQSYGDKQGPQHGMLINTPYVTKDLLQAKRFQAQSLGTTYVYDFPEMIRQVGLVKQRGSK